MSASTVPAVKAKLVELFTAAVDNETQVWRGRPVVERQLNDNVYVLGATTDREWASLGRPQPHQREENYRIDVAVEVYSSSQEPDAPEARLWSIVNALDECVSADVTLGAENVQWAQVERINEESEDRGDGWLYRATLEVAVKARI